MEEQVKALEKKLEEPDNNLQERMKMIKVVKDNGSSINVQSPNGSFSGLRHRLQDQYCGRYEQISQVLSVITSLVVLLGDITSISASRKCKCLSIANLHMVAGLQLATHNYSKGGTYNSVYTEMFLRGQIFVEIIMNMNMNMVFLSLHEDLLDFVRCLSCLQHLTIVACLIGYCAEQGHHLLVSVYMGDEAKQCKVFMPEKIGSWILADAQPLPDPPAIQGDGDEQSSSSSEFFRVRTPTEDRDGVVEGEEDLEAEREENRRKWLEETKTILVYEQLDGELLLLRSEFTLLGTSGYCSFATKLRDCYPEDGVHFTSVRLTLPHVLWPWWPQYQGISYIGANGRDLNPLNMRWDVFKAEIHHAIVHTHQFGIEVVLLRKFDDGDEHQDQRKIFHIPKNSLRTSRKLDYIIHFYHSADHGREPYDDGVLPLDPWPLYTISYKDGQENLLERPHIQPYLEPFEQQGINEDLINLFQGNELGEGGEVDDGDGDGDVGEDREEVEENEEDNEEGAEWQQFTHLLRFIDLNPI